MRRLILSHLRIYSLQSFQSTRLKGLNINTCVSENNILQQSKQDSRTRIQPCAHTHTHTHTITLTRSLLTELLTHSLERTHSLTRTYPHSLMHTFSPKFAHTYTHALYIHVNVPCLFQPAILMALSK